MSYRIIKDENGKRKYVFDIFFKSVKTHNNKYQLRNGQLYFKNIPLSSHYMYIFQRMSASSFDLIDKKNLPVKLVEKNKYKTECPYGLLKNTGYFAYFNNETLSYPVEVENLIDNQQHKLISFDTKSNSIFIEQSLFAWLCNLKEFEKTYTNAGVEISELITVLNDPLPDQSQVSEPQLPLYKIKKWFKENRYLILPDEKVLDMLNFLKAVQGAVTGQKTWKNMLIKTAEEAIAKDQDANSVIKGQSYWREYVKKYADPIELSSAMFGYWMVIERDDNDDFNSSSAYKFSQLFENFVYSENRIDNEQMKQVIKEDILLIDITNTLIRDLYIQNIFYAQNILNFAPRASDIIDNYFIDMPGIDRCFQVKRGGTLKATIAYDPDYIKFTIRKYDSALNTLGHSTYTISSDNNDCFDNTELTTAVKQEIKDYVNSVIGVLVSITDDAGMSAKESFRFVVEMSRQHFHFKKAKYNNKKIQSYAFAVIMEKLATDFVYNGSKGIKYGHDQILFNKKYNKISSGIDCIGFQITGVYILGHTNINIHYEDNIKNLPDEIDIDLMEFAPATEPDEEAGIPFKITTTEKPFFKFQYNEKTYYSEVFDLLDDTESVEFYEPIYENEVIKQLKKVELPATLCDQILDGTLSHVVVKFDWVPDDGRHYFSNGVRNVLANLYGVFDRYKAEDVNDEDKVGMIGVMRKTKKVVSAYDHNGERQEYRNDFVSHVYTVLEDEMLSHSSTYGKGLFNDGISDYYKGLTKYYLKIKNI